MFDPEISTLQFLLCIRYARKRNRERREKEREKISREMRVIAWRLRAELAKFERDKCRRAIIMSKARYALEGERCTAFFLGQEKRKQNKTIYI